MVWNRSMGLCKVEQFVSCISCTFSAKAKARASAALAPPTHSERMHPWQQIPPKESGQWSMFSCVECVWYRLTRRRHSWTSWCTSYPGWHLPVDLQGGQVSKALPPVQRQHRAPLAAVIWSVIDILDELMHPKLVLQNNIELDCDGFEFLAKSPHISLRRLANMFSLNIDLSLLSIWMGVACLQLQEAIFLIFRLIKTKPTRTYHDMFYPKTILRALPSDGKTSEGNKTARPFPVAVMPPPQWAGFCSKLLALVQNATNLTLLHISSWETKRPD